MQAGLQRAIPSAAVLSALLPGLCVTQTRSKVFTSNVMDETRAKRITDHFEYWKARKQYRLTLHNLISSWRAERRANAPDEDAAAQRRRKADELREEAERMQALLREKHMATLAEQLKKAELDHKLAQVQLSRAVRRQDLLQRREAARAERYQRLLEASRNWIRHEELEERINQALDNPQPFGFIANLPVSKGF